MKKYANQRLQNILEDAESIEDVTSDHIEEIKLLQAGRIVLEKYQVRPEQFEDWIVQVEDSGVEYDSRLQRVLVKAVDGASLYEAPNKCLFTWMSTISDKLSAFSNGLMYKNLGSTG